jgi:hypothetical protein
MIMLRPLVHGSIWWGYVYRPDHWPELVATGWVRARKSVQEDARHGKWPPLGNLAPEMKN